MSDIRLTCPQCGAVLSAPASAAGKKARCPRCGTVFESVASGPPEGPQHQEEPDEADAPAGAFGLRLKLLFGGLWRLPLSCYYLARTWGESYELWVRALVCLLPFGIGGVVSWYLWLYLPDDVAFKGALGVLLLTVAIGLPLLVAFFPGSTAARLEKRLARMHEAAEQHRAGLKRLRIAKSEARRERAAARVRLRRGVRYLPLLKLFRRRMVAGVPRYAVVRWFSHGYQVLAALCVIAAICALLAAPFVGARWPLFLAGALGLIALVPALLFIAQMLAVIVDSAQNLWRIHHTLHGGPQDNLEDQQTSEAMDTVDTTGSVRDCALALLRAYVDGSIGGGEVIKRYPSHGDDALLEAIVNALCDSDRPRGMRADEYYQKVATNGIQALEEGWDGDTFRNSLPT